MTSSTRSSLTTTFCNPLAGLTVAWTRKTSKHVYENNTKIDPIPGTPKRFKHESAIQCTLQGCVDVREKVVARKRHSPIIPKRMS